jgi:hypothetical protein
VVTTDANGRYVASNVPSGAVTVTGELAGFQTTRRRLQFNQSGVRVDMALQLGGGVAETVEVRAEVPLIDTMTASKSTVIRPGETPPEVQKQKKDETEAPSLNIQNLQRRASGVLPVRIDVPRAGTAHRFARPLVVDEETEVTFRYKRR